MTFAELGLDPKILQALDLLGFESPTDIQAQTIPLLLEQDRDLMGLARTGTGKTAAFGLPLLHRLERGGNAPTALVLAPTRELAMQISKELERFARFLPDIRILPVYGGTSITTQRTELKRGTDILVATPGRLIDLMERGWVSLADIREVVLDEADEMLNMGFWEDVTKILESLPPERRIRLFSATFPKEVERLANKLMADPVRIQVQAAEKTKADLVHRYVKIDGRHRLTALKRLIDHTPDVYGIVFTRTRMDAQQVAEKLGREGYPAGALHGEMSQQQREAVMSAFRHRQIRLLVATDVAARGIDVDDLTHVFHFHLPDEAESYTHRSGRTARAGKSGISIALVAHNESRKLRNIEGHLKLRLEAISIPTGQEVIARRLHHLAERLKGVTVRPEVQPYVSDWRDQLEGIEADELLARVVQLELERLMKEYKDAPDIEKGTFKDTDGRTERSERGPAGGKLVKIQLAIGAAEGLEWQDLKDMIREACSLDKGDVVSVKVFDKSSVFLIEPKDVDNVISTLSELGYNGRPLKPRVAPNMPDREEGGRGRGRKDFGGGGKSWGQKPWKKSRNRD